MTRYVKSTPKTNKCSRRSWTSWIESRRETDSKASHYGSKTLTKSSMQLDRGQWTHSRATLTLVSFNQMLKRWFNSRIASPSRLTLMFQLREVAIHLKQIRVKFQLDSIKIEKLFMRMFRPKVLRRLYRTTRLKWWNKIQFRQKKWQAAVLNSLVKMTVLKMARTTRLITRLTITSCTKTKRKSQHPYLRRIIRILSSHLLCLITTYQLQKVSTKIRSPSTLKTTNNSQKIRSSKPFRAQNSQISLCATQMP